MNTFGKNITLTTYGESHGESIGGIIDGFPSNIDINIDEIQHELDRRKPGQPNTTQRKEEDKVEILSGIFNGKTTGMPIAFRIKNTDHHSNDYNNIKDLFRPSHADEVYQKKYGVRDYRGGGRQSARETANWVVGGAFAKILLNKQGIFVNAKINSIYGNKSSIKDIINNLHGDSVGGSIICNITGNIPYIGEPVFDKLDAEIAKAIISINGCKGIEFGCGFESEYLLGSEYNKNTSKNNGGIVGGIANGNTISFKCVFKPTPSISLEQEMKDINGNIIKASIKGRHDPCITLRAVPVVEAMTRLVLVNYLYSLLPNPSKA